MNVKNTIASKTSIVKFVFFSMTKIVILGLFCDFWKVPKVFEGSPKSSKSPECSKVGGCDSAL